MLRKLRLLSSNLCTCNVLFGSPRPNLYLHGTHHDLLLSLYAAHTVILPFVLPQCFFEFSSVVRTGSSPSLLMLYTCVFISIVLISHNSTARSLVCLSDSGTVHIISF